MAKRQRKPTTATRRGSDADVDRVLRDRFSGAFRVADCIDRLQRDHAIPPAEIWKRLPSPYRALRAATTLTALTPRLDAYRELRAQVDPTHRADRPEAQRLAALIRSAERRHRALIHEVTAAHLDRSKRWSRPWSPEMWQMAPAEFPAGVWRNPNRWAWIRDRAATLARYLSRRTGRGPLSKETVTVTAFLIHHFYRGYFPDFTFSAVDARNAIIPRRARSSRLV